MCMLKAKKILIDILEEMGFVVFEKDEDDFCLGDYIIDSIQFIQFIVNIEKVLGVELSDDFLQYDILSSANGLANKLLVFIEHNGIDINQLKVTAKCFE